MLQTPQTRCCRRFILMKLMKFGGAMRKHEVHDVFSGGVLRLLVPLGKSRVIVARASARRKRTAQINSFSYSFHILSNIFCITNSAFISYSFHINFHILFLFSVSVQLLHAFFIKKGSNFSAAKIHATPRHDFQWIFRQVPFDIWFCSSSSNLLTVFGLL